MSRTAESTQVRTSAADQAAPEALHAEGLVIRYGNTTAVDDVSIGARRGEFVALLGPSGCGKTTLLRAIAGLNQISSGRISIDGKVVAGSGLHVSPEHRPLNMVFQSYAIWPHLSVRENVAYGLKAQKLKKSEIHDRVNDTLAAVGLLHYTDRHATELSGGQQQRVALARALATRPALMLYDEPLSNLDTGLRERVREQIVELHHRFETTTLYVTHDQSEALSMADQVVLMNAGRVAQVDAPRALYHRPNSEFAAKFVGTINPLRATVSRVGDRSATVELAELPGNLTLNGAPRIPSSPGEQGVAIVRPEYFEVARTDGSSDTSRQVDDNTFHGTVERAAFIGSRLQCSVNVHKWSMSVEVNGFEDISEGDQVTLRVAPQRIIWIPDGDVER